MTWIVKLYETAAEALNKPTSKNADVFIRQMKKACEIVTAYKEVNHRTEIVEHLKDAMEHFITEHPFELFNAYYTLDNIEDIIRHPIFSELQKSELHVAFQRKAHSLFTNEPVKAYETFFIEDRLPSKKGWIAEIFADCAANNIAALTKINTDLAICASVSCYRFLRNKRDKEDKKPEEQDPRIEVFKNIVEKYRPNIELPFQYQAEKIAEALQIFIGSARDNGDEIAFQSGGSAWREFIKRLCCQLKKIAGKSCPEELLFERKGEPLSPGHVMLNLAYDSRREGYDASTLQIVRSSFKEQFTSIWEANSQGVVFFVRKLVTNFDSYKYSHRDDRANKIQYSLELQGFFDDIATRVASCDVSQRKDISLSENIFFEIARNTSIPRRKITLLEKAIERSEIDATLPNQKHAKSPMVNVCRDMCELASTLDNMLEEKDGAIGFDLRQRIVSLKHKALEKATDYADAFPIDRADDAFNICIKIANNADIMPALRIRVLQQATQHGIRIMDEAPHMAISKLEAVAKTSSKFDHHEITSMAEELIVQLQTPRPFLPEELTAFEGFMALSGITPN